MESGQRKNAALGFHALVFESTGQFSRLGGLRTTSRNLHLERPSVFAGVVLSVRTSVISVDRRLHHNMDLGVDARLEKCIRSKLERCSSASKLPVC